MESLKEIEIAKSYEGKPFIPEKLRKIAIGSGNTSALVYSRRITKSQGALVGITDEIFERWWDADISVMVNIELDEESHLIKECTFDKHTVTEIENRKYHFSSLTPTDEDLQIFINIMEYVTTDEEN